jgi:uncharacterized membrane protein (Fun14 family)
VSELLARGVSGFIGFIFGYLIGRGIRILLYILGFFLLILVVLEAIGYININWDKIVDEVSNFVSGILDPTQYSSQSISQLINWLQDNWSTIIGFFLGIGFGGNLVRRQVPIGS